MSFGSRGGGRSQISCEERTVLFACSVCLFVKMCVLQGQPSSLEVIDVNQQDSCMVGGGCEHARAYVLIPSAKGIRGSLHLLAA